ncbi:hypothetical protein L228DRAFT_250774 [Xylona heveae TC161]|uniref:Uncharacterized protein n=1 Tax=Xylona heveae (strain CBS 132557 / TC161) TaxID=1328760 RepID=A0A164ZYG8_XYLHT|nr:hypothetical protein L228DRAFT_250774 [Xylona heveae TC161]KZF19701.1 hypothetical protein L228DRAFT_250774 [Xylona heveae TC161]
MRRPYITMLILVSLLLGGVQEYLYQRSAWLAGKNRGLIEFRSAQSISISNYFAWKYMPTIVLVTYGVLWQIVDYEVKRLEPYYQLSKPDGALAAHSLNLDYLTYWSYLAPVKALRYRQWAVVSSSVATLLAGGLVPTLQSASVTLYPDSKNRRVNELKFVRINPIWSRLLTTSLVLVAVLGLILMLQLRRRSGLLSDPKGIAGIAAMAQKSHILMDFSGLDTAKPDVIHQKLRYQRYILYKSCFWQGEYVGHDTDEPGIVPNANHHNPHPPMLRLKAGIPFIAFMIIVMILIPVFTFTSANIVTEKLPFLFTAMAVLIKLSWGTLECDVRMIEPFYILSKRNAPPKTLTLDYTGTVPGYIIFHSLINKHFLISLVGIGAIATEVLTVCVSSFAVKGSDFFPAHNNNNNNTTTPAAADHSLTHSLFARLPQALSTSPNMNTTAPDPRQQLGGDQTVRSFWISFSLAQLILLFLILAATLVYLRRRHAFLPRQPNTIASILAFIHQSTMLWQFIDTERMDSRTMTQHLTALGQTYGLGVFRGRDGEDHCGVDREPLISDYRHGHKYDFARQNRVENWEVL